MSHQRALRNPEVRLKVANDSRRVWMRFPLIRELFGARESIEMSIKTHRFLKLFRDRLKGSSESGFPSNFSGWNRAEFGEADVLLGVSSDVLSDLWLMSNPLEIARAEVSTHVPSGAR
jgi:hypothetical protein